MGGIRMKEKLEDEVFSIVDEMYNDVKQNSNNQEILEVLMKAAKALNKGMSAKVAAVRTVNGITLVILTKRPNLGDEFNKNYNRLTAIATDKTFGSPTAGIGDLRVQFE
jgi:Enterocin A Immunity.